MINEQILILILHNHWTILEILSHNPGHASFATVVLLEFFLDFTPAYLGTHSQRPSLGRIPLPNP